MVALKPAPNCATACEPVVVVKGTEVSVGMIPRLLGVDVSVLGALPDVVPEPPSKMGAVGEVGPLLTGVVLPGDV